MKADDFLASQARVRPRHPALLLDDGTTLDFAALEARTARVAATLAAHGIRRGDTILSLLPAGASFVSLVHAMPRMGALLAVLSPNSTAAEVARALALTCPKLVVACRGARGLAAGSADPTAILEVEADAGWPATDRTEVDASAEVPQVDRAIPQTMLFTSGTTGAPKGILHTPANYAASTEASTACLGSGPRDAWLAAMPLHHMGGLAILMRSVILGTTVVLQAGFDARRVAEALLSGRVSQVSVVPTMLDRLVMALDGRALPKALRFVLVGGALATDVQLRRAREAGLPVAPTYGMTETTSQVATAAPRQEEFGTGEVGLALPGNEIRVVDPAGHVFAKGTGAIEVRGPVVAAGRLVAAGRIESLVDGEGWLATRDAGHLDDDGTLTVLGRLDEVIVTGGENVAPGEVEAALADHPAVAEVGVVGLPDDAWGMAVAAFVVPQSGTSPSLEDLRTHGAQRLARYKLPRVLRLVPALPRTASGKLKRRELVRD